ncbi:rough deal protein C-terminal region-domain-containing protein [Coemansia spiralis]|nr:rough deal protein C-terminal region-domain-containing protein [Coemansia spiralis]
MSNTVGKIATMNNLNDTIAPSLSSNTNTDIHKDKSNSTSTTNQTARIRQHLSDEIPSSPKHTKRRKVAVSNRSQEDITDRPNSEYDSDWQLQLCSGSDETLQISRIARTGYYSTQRDKNSNSATNKSNSSRFAASENTFDSYRLETLAAAERTFAGFLQNELPDYDSHWCKATVSADLVAITISNQVHILTSDCKSQVAVIRHDSRILTTALNCDSSFVAFGDESGMLFIIHIKTRQPVFSQTIKTSDSQLSTKAKDTLSLGISALRFATCGSVDGSIREELALTTNDGTLVRFSGIRLCLLSQAIVDEDMTLAARLKQEIRVEFVSLFASKRAIHHGGVDGLSVFYSQNKSHIVVAGNGSACMSCWERTESISDNTDTKDRLPSTQLADLVTTECSGSGYTKILLSLDHRYLVALSENGSLDVYECSTLTLVFRYDDVVVDDFSVLAPGTSNSGSSPPTSILVAIITKPIQASEGSGCEASDNDSDKDTDDDALCRRLLVISLPAMELIYSMDVSVWCWFAHDARLSHDIADSILFVEGTVSDGAQSFHLRSLYETVPLERLKHFLRAGRYAEAESFAEKCEIPLSLVYHKRLEEFLVDSLANTSRESEQALSVEKILDLLGHIDDDIDFSIDVCLRISIPSYDGVQRLLQHARYLAAHSAPGDMQRILNTVQRLGTWATIAVDTTSSTSSLQKDSFDSRAWHNFRIADLASCMRSYIAQGDMMRAGAIWRRHCDENRLRSDIVGAIQGFPIDVDMQALAGWLRAEVLPTLQTCQQWQELAVWVEQRARMLASKRKKLSDALHLVDLLDIGTWSADLGNSSSHDYKVRVSICSPLAATPQKFIDNSVQTAKWTLGLAQASGFPVFPAPASSEHAPDGEPALQSCLFLRKQLLDLVYLRERHNMVLTLDDYDQLSYSMIATEFLDRVGAPELLGDAYFNHFIPYSELHQLDFAQILREYCIEMMNTIDREDIESVAQRNDGNTNTDDSSDGIALAAFSTSAGVGRHSWEPRVLQLLSCLYLSCVGRRNYSSPSTSDIGMSAYCQMTKLPPLTSSRTGLLKTYSELMLEVMRRSSIPWSPSIGTAIKDTLSLISHYSSMDAELERSQIDIKEQFRLMCLKRMLLLHGLSDFHISNTKMAYPLLQWLVRKTDNDSIMSDVLQLVDAYHHLSRTSAYVFRFQALCDAGEIEKAAELMFFIDAAEYKMCTDVAIQKYMPMEVARRGLCWIREVLDNMPFGESASRIQFKKLVDTAMAALRALKGLSSRYSRSTTSSASANNDGVAASRPIATSELQRLQLFIDRESTSLGVVWQLLVDGGIMVSPGELEQESMREQILSELLEQHWLRAYTTDRLKGGFLSEKASSCRNEYKGKIIDVNEASFSRATLNAVHSTQTKTAGIPREMIGLPLIPANIKTLSAMLRFSPAQLGFKIVSKCLSLRLYTMALDMCQQLVEMLKPLPSLSSPSAASSEWLSTVHALVSCERELSNFLANVAAGDTGLDDSSNIPVLSGKAQGLLLRRLVTVCQSACLKCASHPHLVSFLDAYSCWELAQAIFNQTTDGDFALLTKRFPAIGIQTMYAGSSKLQASTSLPDTLAANSSDLLDPVYLADSHEDALSSWLGSLYSNSYCERGLVLDTDRTMHLVYRFASALRWLPAADLCGNNNNNNAEQIAGVVSSSAKPKDKSSISGKNADLDYDYAKMDEEELKSLNSEDIRFEVIRRCADLIVHLAHNRHWILAVHVLQLAISHLARSSFVIQKNDLPAEASESLDVLRQRLSSGGISKDELAAFFNVSSTESPTAADIQCLVSKSLVKSLQQRGIDAVFIFSSMLMEPPAKAYQHLSTAMSHSGLLPSRVIALANIGSACSLVWQQQALLDRCRAVAAAARWSEQLQLLQLKFDVALLNNPKPELLEPLVRPMLLKTGMDITTLLEFAEAFRLDETFIILEYILLCCSAQNVDGYQARILGVASEIANTKLLERTYIDALENGISTYDYERLQFVVQLLQELRPQDKGITKYSAVLDILCSYDRKAAPTHDELLFEHSRTFGLQDIINKASFVDHRLPDNGNYIVDTGRECTSFDDTSMSYQGLLAKYSLARKRLPFHSLVNGSPWTTLLPELAADTVDRLLPLAQPLELSEDDFYMNLIDSMLKQWKSGNAFTGMAADASTIYELATNKATTHFNTIQQLIRCFKDPEAAISTIKHVSDELPCGPDRIAVLKLGIKLLRKWGQYIKRMPEPERTQMMAKAETIYLHFEKSYTDAETELSLRRSGLEEYLALFVDAQGSAAVIDALHPCLKANAKLLNRYLESAVIFDKESEWLELPSARYQSSLHLLTSQEAVVRQRILYLLRIYPVSDAIKYLMDFAYAPKGGMSCLCRARALAILFSFASYEDISQLQHPENVHRYFQALLYLADFEHAGIPQSTADFLDCDKAALARSIWIDNHEEPRAVQLVCNMCLDFMVNDCDLILRILTRLLAAERNFYVANALSIISNVPCYSSIAEIPALWNQATLGCLLQIAQRTDDNWIENTFTVLGSCIRSRYLLTIDASAIILSLLKESKMGSTIITNTRALQIACAAFDAFPSSSKTEMIFLDFIGSMEPKQVHEFILCILDLTNTALSSTQNTQLFVDWAVLRSLSLVFDFVDANELYEQVLLHPPLGKAIHAFVQNRIRQNKLTNAVTACLERNKQQLAMQLVCQYYKTRPAEALAEDAKRAGIILNDIEAPRASRNSSTTSDIEGDSTVNSMNSEASIENTQEDTSVIVRLTSKVSDQQKLGIYIRSHS